MADTPSTEEIKRAAKALFDERVQAVTAAAEATRDRIVKQAAAAEAERCEAAAWTGALRRGWTESELKAMGLLPPARKAPGRPRRAPATAPGRTPPAAGATGDAEREEAKAQAQERAAGVGIEAQDHAAIEAQA